LADEGPAACLYDSGAHKEALGAEVGITHPLFVLFQISEFSLR
jgi:hypothetical protein